MNRKVKYILAACILTSALTVFGFKILINQKSHEKEVGSQTANTGFFSDFFNSNDAPDNLSPLDFKSWCEKAGGGLTMEKSIGSFNYSAFYTPSEYMACSELDYNQKLNKTSFTEKVKEYGNLAYFTFCVKNSDTKEELLKYNISDEGEYEYRLDYLSFKMQNDFKLTNGKDTLNCIMYHYERVYNMAGYAKCVVAFEKPDLTNTESLKLIYDDKLFNNGRIIIGFDSKTLNNIPKINL